MSRPNQGPKPTFKLAAIALATLAVPVLAASPAEVVKSRVAGYKQLGAAFKAVNDAARSGKPASAATQPAAQIVAASRAQYKWFPAGSGPQPRIKTAAKREIWSDPKGFRAAQDAFARQAAAFQKAVASGKADLKSESRKLGAACKGCHDKFREESD